MTSYSINGKFDTHSGKMDIWCSDFNIDYDAFNDEPFVYFDSMTDGNWNTYKGMGRVFSIKGASIMYFWAEPKNKGSGEKMYIVLRKTPTEHGFWSRGFFTGKDFFDKENSRYQQISDKVSEDEKRGFREDVPRCTSDISMSLFENKSYPFSKHFMKP